MNHQYKIVATSYRPDGALTTNAVSLYADNPEQAYKTFREYDVQRHSETNMKAYKVELFTLAYKPVNIDDFTAMYELV